MKILLLIASLTILGSQCTKSPFENKSLDQVVSDSTSGAAYPNIAGAKVKELFITIFPKDYSPEEWKDIFTQTNELSSNRRKLRTIEGKTDEASSQLRTDLIGKNADILGAIQEKSLFILSWSAQEENCKVSDKTLKINCKPFDLDNPLNGEMPGITSPLQWFNPDPVKDTIRIHYLNFELTKSNSATGQNYELTVRLKVERSDEKELWLKGDVLPKTGSRFMNSNGSLTSEFYPYGYSELSLELKH